MHRELVRGLLSAGVLAFCAVAAEAGSASPAVRSEGAAECPAEGAAVRSEGSLEGNLEGNSEGILERGTQDVLEGGLGRRAQGGLEGVSEGWLRAWEGREPQASVLQETGVVLPTAAEVRRLPVRERVRRQRALKLVLLERALRARAERHRVSEENLAACAELAAREGAPRESVAWLQEMAKGNLSPRRRYVLNGALASLAELYAVDELSIRYFVEACGLGVGELRELLPWLPLESLFCLTPTETLPPAHRMSDQRLVREMMAELKKGLRGVHDRESADAASEVLRPLLLLQETVMRSRLAEQKGQAEMEGQGGLGGLGGLGRAQEGAAPGGQDLYRPWESLMRQNLREERQRLREARFFGSSRLQALDYLLSF